MMDIIDAADYLIYLFHEDKREIKPITLQKLLYFAEGYSYVFDDRPLFDTKFYVGRHGPVYAELYYKYKKFKGLNIDIVVDGESIVNKSNPYDIEHLEVIYDDMSNYDAFELISVIIEHDVVKDAELGSYITSNKIGRYFKEKY